MQHMSKVMLFLSLSLLVIPLITRNILAELLTREVKVNQFSEYHVT